MEVFEKAIVNSLRKEIGGRGKLSTKEIASLLERPADPRHGDFAFPCFALAKKYKKAPPLIATELKDKIELPDTIEKIEQIAGYLNFTIDPEALALEVLQDIFKQQDAYGATNLGRGRTIIVEFSSPNIAKPFGIGHLRSTNIGACLSRVHAFLKFKVIRINHLGDWGTQFGKIITAYKRWGNADFLKGDPIMNLYELYVKFHAELENEPELNDEARAWFARLEQGEQEAKELWEWFRELSLKELKTIYSLFDISFDHQLGESFYVKMMDDSIQRLKDNKLLEESDGAEIVRLEESLFGELPPAVIKKRDKSTLYITRDISAAEYRHETHDFDQMLYVVGMPQELHFQQLFSILSKLGYEWAERCQHVSFGHLTLKGAEQSMSTRSGNIIFLKDVIDKAAEMALEIMTEKNPDLPDKEKVAEQIALAALIYADFSARRRKDVKFSWNDILNFDGETGPYMQYTLVRMSSILEKFTGTLTDNIDFSQLSSIEEKELIKHLGSFNEALVRCAEEREPFVLAQYAMELAKHYNKFYNHFRVLSEDGEASLARVLLTQCAAQVLTTALQLLGIPMPQKM